MAVVQILDDYYSGERQCKSSCQILSQLTRYRNFAISQIEAVHLLRFRKFEFLTASRVERPGLGRLHHRPNLFKLFKCCKDIAVTLSANLMKIGPVTPEITR